MSKILIHPTVRVADLRPLLRDSPVVLKYRLQPGAQPSPTHSVQCTCGGCGWVGPDPVFADTADTFNPPRGDIPRCRKCGSFSLSYQFAEAS